MGGEASESLEAGKNAAPRAATLVVILEGLEEVGVSLFELLLAQMHFPSTFPDDAHDQGMRNGRLNVQTLSSMEMRDDYYKRTGAERGRVLKEDRC